MVYSIPSDVSPAQVGCEFLATLKWSSCLGASARLGGSRRRQSFNLRCGAAESLSYAGPQARRTKKALMCGPAEPQRFPTPSNLQDILSFGARRL
ncbi:hypothetical protein MGN70_013888 [Eutypa lata]|nr:hypothetical protein MGN70_013888 [Eutypa lata]